MFNLIATLLNFTATSSIYRDSTAMTEYNDLSQEAPVVTFEDGTLNEFYNNLMEGYGDFHNLISYDDFAYHLISNEVLDEAVALRRDMCLYLKETVPGWPKNRFDSDLNGDIADKDFKSIVDGYFNWKLDEATFKYARQIALWREVDWQLDLSQEGNVTPETLAQLHRPSMEFVEPLRAVSFALRTLDSAQRRAVFDCDLFRRLNFKYLVKTVTGHGVLKDRGQGLDFANDPVNQDVYQTGDYFKAGHFEIPYYLSLTDHTSYQDYVELRNKDVEATQDQWKYSYFRNLDAKERLYFVAENAMVARETLVSNPILGYVVAPEKLIKLEELRNFDLKTLRPSMFKLNEQGVLTYQQDQALIEEYFESQGELFQESFADYDMTQLQPADNSRLLAHYMTAWPAWCWTEKAKQEIESLDIDDEECATACTSVFTAKESFEEQYHNLLHLSFYETGEAARANSHRRTYYNFNSIREFSIQFPVALDENEVDDQYLSNKYFEAGNDYKYNTYPYSLTYSKLMLLHRVIAYSANIDWSDNATVTNFFSSDQYLTLDPTVQLAVLKAVCLQYQAQGKKVVFTNGCFDLLHVGHYSYLQQAREMGDLLIVGVNSSASVKRLKGNDRPVNDTYQRCKALSALDAVSAVVPFGHDTPLEIIEVLKPDVLVKGGDYKVEDIVGYAQVTANGGQVVTLPYLDGHSTTALIAELQQQGKLPEKTESLLDYYKQTRAQERADDIVASIEAIMSSEMAEDAEFDKELQELVEFFRSEEYSRPTLNGYPFHIATAPAKLSDSSSKKKNQKAKQKSKANKKKKNK